MSLFSSLMKRFGRSDEWKQAEGVLPVERALADEHEALHGESITAALEAVTVEFDPAQFIDLPALARDFRDALGPRDSGIPVAEHTATKSEPDLTPRDGIGRFLMRDASLKAALEAYEEAPAADRAQAATALAAALSKTFNALLDSRLMDVEAFRPFVEAGAVDALGEAPAGATDTDANAHFLRRANRELLEAAFPNELALMRDRRLAVVFDAARKQDTAALCLSGGGIRSSTFALGVMQGLAKNGLLAKFDYLSTVSGGGLSGGWLSAWMRRDGAKAVHEALRIPGREKIQPEPEPVQGLRAFSHWLTPRAGAMSVDSWTVIATIVRNLLLNWLVLLPLIAGIVMGPRLLAAVLALDFQRPKEGGEMQIAVLLTIGLLGMLCSAAYLEWVRDSGGDAAKGKRNAPSESRVLLFFLVPRVIGAVLVALTLFVGNGWDAHRKDDQMFGAIGVTAAVVLIVSVLVVPGMALIRRGSRSIASALWRSVKAVLSGMLGYVVPILALAGFLVEWPRNLYVTVAPVVLLLGTVAASQLYAGLTSDEASDAEREWAARANAWIMIVSVAYLVSSAMVLFGPHLLDQLWQKVTVLGVGGVSSWLTVSLSKRSTDSGGGKPGTGDMLRNAALSLAMPAVVVCLIVGLAAANDGTLNLMCLDDSLSVRMRCSPPSDDSTSVPMLRYIAASKEREALQAAERFRLSLATAPGGVPRSAAEVAARATADSAVIAASRTWTVAAAALDSAATRLIRRAGEQAGSTGEGVEDSTLGLVDAFRRFTARRTAAIPADTSGVTDPGLLAGVQLILSTDTALKSGLVKRTSSDSAVQALVDSAQAARSHHQPSENALWLGVLAAMLVMIASGLFFSMVVNTNTFSLHAMWKVRTVRAFLGTTRASAARNPNPFTGFDSDDDVPMRDLWPARVSPVESAAGGDRSGETLPPMHVLNVTLNLAAGRNLAWQQRKGESMTLTPLHAGSAFTGYRPMAPRAKSPAGPAAGESGYGGTDGVSLGTAMAISGAAASPNDGAGTTALGAFLMTFFNARMGWWLGNPGAPGADTWQRSAPKWRLTPILSEMFGLTSDRSQYVYLSDGGHFENLALYEMVLRRCRFIVLSDAGADPGYTFEDLGNAVRKIRIDFGIPIEFEEPVRIRSGDSAKGAYWATARIRYSAIDMPPGCTPDDYDGVLVYIKPAVYGVEPRDVVNYANLSPSFPQESSADQFFSESQFESYRALGAWIVDQLVANPAAPGAPVTVKAQRPGSLLSSWPNLRPKPVAPGY